MLCPLGEILLIANPASQSGHGKRLAEKAVSILNKELPNCSIDVLLTSNPRHATDIAAASEHFDTVIVIGGDGAVHEVVNGLMKINPDARPRLGVIPAGSGNDFAKSLGMPLKPELAIHALSTAVAKPSDVGRVNDTYFAETLSFGLDAAIAHDSMERRKKSGKKGLRLYGESAISQIKENFRLYHYTLQVDGSAPIEGASYTFAVQNGPYYGGGFMICPDARLDDGYLNLCISHPPMNRLGAAIAFAKAKSGKHTSIKQIEMIQAKTISVTFKEDIPVQTDGEFFEGESFNVSLEHDAIKFLYALNDSEHTQ